MTRTSPPTPVAGRESLLVDGLLHFFQHQLLEEGAQIDDEDRIARMVVVVEV